MKRQRAPWRQGKRKLTVPVDQIDLFYDTAHQHPDDPLGFAELDDRDLHRMKLETSSGVYARRMALW